MATVNFSVPDEIKRAFDAAFAGRNKSAILAGLMKEAVEEERRREVRARAVDALLKIRSGAPPLSDEEIRKAREEGRP